MYYQPEIDFKPDEVIDYLRKSRTDDPSLSVEEVLSKHEAILDEWSEKYLGGKVPEENKYREIVSGETIADRPEIKAVLKRIESPKIKAVKVVEVQRLSRGDLEDAGRLIKLLRYTNTLVITPPKTYDLRNEYDRDIFERELKRGNEFLEYQKRIMGRGRLLSVQQGNYLGSLPPYGYEKTVIMEGKKKCHTLKIKEDEAETVKMIFDMYVNQDMGRVNICHRLNELGIKPQRTEFWQQDTIKTILENEHYIGKVRWNWRKTINIVEDGEISKSRPKNKVGEYLLYDGKHEAIISEEMFNAARAKQGRNHRAKSNTKIRNPFAGLLYCQCGRAMSLRTYVKDGVERSAPRLLCDNQVYCKTSSCLYDDVLNSVRNILKENIQDFEVQLKNTNKDSVQLHENIIKTLKNKLKELEAKEISQWEAQADPDPAKRMPQHIFQILNEKLLKERAELEQALQKAYETMPNPTEYEEKLYKLKDALEALDSTDISPEKKNSLLKTCIERIEYRRDKSERIKSQQIMYYSKEEKRTKYTSPLPTGGNWTAPPIELDVKLRL